MYQHRGGEDAELLHHQVARANPDAVWLVSPDWDELKFCTDAYESIWGRSIGALVDDPKAFLEGVHPDDREAVRAVMDELADETAVEREFRVIPPDGPHHRNVWFQGRPIYDGDDRFVAIMGAAREVTERRRYQRQLEYTNERLEAFNGFLSHDIKNQLQTAMGYLQLAREEAPSDHLDRVESALDRMNEMTSGILALPRFDVGEVDREPVSVAELARESWGSVETGGATLTITGDTRIRVDGSLFRNVFENLFRNAVVHNEGDVAVGIGPLPDERGFYVEDDGRGIPPNERERVFEYGRSTEGYGLGLTLVREIVELHGGSIVVEDAPSGGARFVVECAVCR